MPENPHETGNLRKVLQLKIGAKIRLTTNINVSDGLTNGAMGSISNIIIDEQKQKIKAVLIKFDNETIGEDAKKKQQKKTSNYKHINKDAVPIEEIQVSFPAKGAQSFHATRDNFHLV